MGVTTYGGGIGMGRSSGVRSWTDAQFASGNTTTGLNYPSPFLKFEQQYIPQNMKELYTIIAHAYLTDSNVNPAIENMSAYPITKLHCRKPHFIKEDETFEPLDDYWKDVLEKKLDARTFNISLGYDFFGYGMAFASVYRPFDRWLVCNSCKTAHNTRTKGTKWKWKHMDFYVECSKCEAPVKASVVDKPKPTTDGVNLIKWSPYNMDIKHNPITGKSKYTYAIPNDIKSAIIKGDPDHLLEDPLEFIQAVVGSVKGKTPALVRFDDDQIFVLSRPSMSLPGSSCVGWGMPMMISSLRDIFFKNIMRRAQAMVLHEHIIPFRVFSPSVLEQPSVMANMGTWRAQLEGNYYKWRANPLHIMTSPIPLNVQQVGAQGKALALFAEMQMADQSIIKGMNIPREFVEGGLTYSGSSVSIRMLENILHDYVQRSNRFMTWVVKKISQITGVTAVDVEYAKFKMADDIQLKNLYFSAYQGGAVSNDKLGEILEYDGKDELSKRAKEEAFRQIETAAAQAKAQQRLNNIAQEYSMAMPAVMGNMQNPADPAQTNDMNQQLNQVGDPAQQQAMLQQLAQQDPYMAQTLDAKQKLEPAKLMAEIQKMEGKDDAEAEEELQQLYYTNPNKWNVMKLFFSPKVESMQAKGKVGVGGNSTNANGVNMNPAPQVLAPRGVNRSM